MARKDRYPPQDDPTAKTGGNVEGDVVIPPPRNQGQAPSDSAFA